MTLCSASGVACTTSAISCRTASMIAGFQSADIDHHVQHRCALPHSFQGFRDLGSGRVPPQWKSDGNAHADR